MARKKKRIKKKKVKKEMIKIITEFNEKEIGAISDTFSLAFKKELIQIIFSQSQPDDSVFLVKKILLTPTGLKVLLEALEETIEAYEKKYGGK